MSGFFQNLLNDAAGAFFGSAYLRDYQHAAKTFRTNSYQNAPHLKFLFHTYFEINPQAFQSDSNYGLLVKEVKLPSFAIQTAQMNQYNRKRIVQTKVRYEPIEISFHDDNLNQVNKLWEAYFKYYYNDSTKPGTILAGRGSPPAAGPAAAAGYNERTQYQPSITGQDDWGFIGGSNTPDQVRVPFFKNITVFGFNQHNFTAYTFINPIITNFSHDTYNYSEAAGTMTNRMTIDYETVAYNYGAMDGRSPGNIVTGFGDPATYDTVTSPNMIPGANGNILGQGGLVDAAGSTLESLAQGDILGAIKTAGTAYNANKNINLKETLQAELSATLRNASQNTPNNRNTLFSFNTAGASPGPVATAGAPTVNAATGPKPITNETTAGKQNNGSNLTGGFSQPTDLPWFGRA